MGHSVTGHKSKCRGLHGHSYDIIATVDDKVIDDHTKSSDGMVIDFGDLKQAMMDVIDSCYDHGFIIWKDDPRAKLLKDASDLWQFEARRFHLSDYIPTAENLAKAWFQELDEELRAKYNINLLSLEVFETPTSSALYTRENWVEDARKDGPAAFFINPEFDRIAQGILEAAGVLGSTIASTLDEAFDFQKKSKSLEEMAQEMVNAGSITQEYADDFLKKHRERMSRTAQTNCECGGDCGCHRH